MRKGVFVAVIVTAALAIVPASASAKIKFFQTPSGNIACVLGAGLARCDIQEHSWTAPSPPASCMDLDYGNGLQVVGGHPGSYVCAGDTVFSPNNPVLHYGDKITVNRFRCKSKPTGVRCVNRNSMHGFFISRERVNLF
jgi:hypothetical protein